MTELSELAKDVRTLTEVLKTTFPERAYTTRTALEDFLSTLSEEDASRLPDPYAPENKHIKNALENVSATVMVTDLFEALGVDVPEGRSVMDALDELEAATA